MIPVDPFTPRDPMNTIDRAISHASRRLFVNDALVRLTTLATAAAGLAIAARVVEKAISIPFPWQIIAPSLAGAVVVSALGWTWIVRRSRLSAAVALDEAAGLRESLSTALTLKNATDPWSTAVIETAQARAAGLNVAAALPYRRPAKASTPLFLSLGLMVVWFVLPDLDLLKLLESKKVAQAQQAEIVRVKADINTDQKKLEELLARTGVKVSDEKGDGDSAANPDGTPQTAEELQRVQIKKLTTLADKLEMQRNGEKAQQFQAVKDAMRQLRQPGPGPMGEFSRQLARGNFQQAKAQLDDLAKKLADGSLADDQKRQMQDQLKNLSEQLDKIAKDTSQLQKQLQQAGLSPEQAQKLASSPEALKNTVANLDALSGEQKQGLINLASQMAQSGQQSQQMSQAMQQAAQNMSQQGMSQEGAQAMQNLSQQLSEGEMAQNEMANLDAALSEAKSQLSKMGQCKGSGEGEDGKGGSEGEGGDSEGQGNGDGKGKGNGRGQMAGNQSGQGTGGGGQGNGAGPNAQDAPFELSKSKANVKTGQGPIIGSKLVFGEQVRGQSVAEFSAAVQSASQAASESMENLTVPRELHDSVKAYFGTLQAKAKANAAPGTPAPAPAPAAPAQPAPDANKK
jgi:hypothetical protein